MGTKRHMVDHVRDAVLSVEPSGKLVDLFSGMGTVAARMQEDMPVVLNDAMHFTAALARARFLGGARTSTWQDAVQRLRPAFDQQLAYLSSRYHETLAAERAALRGSQADLVAYMAAVKHAANSAERRRAAHQAAESSGESHYQLVAIYFAGGYFSMRQSVALDALRAAIDEDGVLEDRDWLLAAWLGAASLAVNAPGHTAQYLSAGSAAGYKRVLRAWTHDVLDDFAQGLRDVQQLGSQTWRTANEVRVGDALAAVAAGNLSGIGVVYADPPYTRDHYSRFYHVYETMYRYDFPDAKGQGRTRSDGFVSAFSSKRAVASAFHGLFRSVSRMKVPLVVSYPSAGLLQQAGHSVEAIATQHKFAVELRQVDAQHSTLGASRGASRVEAVEHLFVCRPLDAKPGQANTLTL